MLVSDLSDIIHGVNKNFFFLVLGYLAFSCVQQKENTILL